MMEHESLNDRLQSYQEQLFLRPSDGLLWYEYGHFLDQEYDYPIESIEAFEKAIEFGIEYEGNLRLGRLLTIHGRYEEGITLLKECLKEKPSVHGYCYLAKALLDNEHFDEAEEACRLAIQLEPGFEEAIFIQREK